MFESSLNELNKISITQRPTNIRHIHQTPELCELAVKQDGLSLEFIKYQTPRICKLAVTQNSEAIKFVKLDLPELFLI